VARAGGRQRSPLEIGAEEDSDFYVRALARGLSILGLFDSEHPDWSLNEICTRTGMSKTTAYRMVRTLEATEFISYDARTERYHLGRALIPAAYLAMSYVGFVRVAHPLLENLAEETGETVELAVSAPGGAIVVDQVASRNPFRLNLPIGRVQNLASTSSFRIHTAYLPAAEQRRLLAKGTPARTPNTMTDPDLLLERMAAEKAEGLAYDLEEQDLGVCAVSAPVLERDGGLRAVLTVVAPAERFGVKDRKKKSEAVRATASKLTGLLGGAPPGD
jgi:IclR family KDG regulon transcriptional repressor